MQHQEAKDNETLPGGAVRRQLLAAVLGLCAAGAAIALFVAARLPFAPTPAECAARDHGTMARHLGAGLVAAAATAIVLVLGSALPWLRRRGPFALVAAALLGSGMALLVVPPAFLPAPLQRPLVSSLLLGGAAVAAMPLLAERGLGSLALVAAVAVLPALLAVRRARLEAHAARPLLALRTALAPQAVAPAVVVLLAPEVDDATALALPFALQDRQGEPAPDLLTVRADSSTVPWLERMGRPVYLLREDGCTLRPFRAPGSQLAAGLLRVGAHWQRDAAGAIRNLLVEAEHASAAHLAILLTPVGELPVTLDEHGRGTLDAAAAGQLRGWLAAMPTAAAIRVLVVPPTSADPYGWADLHT